MEKYITYKKNPSTHYALSLLIFAWTFVIVGIGFITISVIYANELGPVTLIGIATGLFDIIFGLATRFRD